jgi:hypothetical protein
MPFSSSPPYAVSYGDGVSYGDEGILGAFLFNFINFYGRID